MLMNSSLDNQIADWDFNAVGGAIGFYPTGMILGPYSLITNLTVNAVSAVTSGGLATVAFGFRTLDQTPVVVGASMIPVAFSTLVLNTPLNWISPTAPGRNTMALEICLFIGVSPLTAGRLIFYCEYFNSDI